MECRYLFAIVFLQRFSTESAFKRTVLDMIAGELIARQVGLVLGTFAVFGSQPWAG